MLAREYGWLPGKSDEVDWADVVRYMEIINNRLENKQREKIGEYIILLNAIHAPEPGKMLESLQGLLCSEAVDDEVGDIKKLKEIKARFAVKGGSRKHGD